MRQFVKTLGLTGRLAQMLVERHGKHTEARLKQDLYFCLHGMPGVTFRRATCLPCSHILLICSACIFVAGLVTSLHAPPLSI